MFDTWYIIWHHFSCCKTGQCISCYCERIICEFPFSSASLDTGHQGRIRFVVGSVAPPSWAAKPSLSTKKHSN